MVKGSAFGLSTLYSARGKLKHLTISTNLLMTSTQGNMIVLGANSDNNDTLSVWQMAGRLEKLLPGGKSLLCCERTVNI